MLRRPEEPYGYPVWRSLCHDRWPSAHLIGAWNAIEAVLTAELTTQIYGATKGWHVYVVEIRGPAEQASKNMRPSRCER